MESQIVEREVHQDSQNIQNISKPTVEDILITHELSIRPVRPPNYAAENHALVQLAECMAQTPQKLLQLLTDLAVQLCKSGSAGISLIEADADGEYFSWVAMSGVYTPFLGGRTPRHFSPCAVTLERNAPQLFYWPVRLFTYFSIASTPIVEGLVVPFMINGQLAGTIWIVGHDEQQNFDAEDVRIMTSLARFSGAAVQVIQSLDAEAAANRALKEKFDEHLQAVEALRQSQSALLELNATLEQRVEERTNDLERSNRELDQFAYVASHDLKAPLRGIGQLASWVLEDAKDLLPTASQEHLAKLNSRVKRLDTLLDDLLAYSRAGRHRHPVEQVDTHELTTSVVDLTTLPPNFTIQIAPAMPKLHTERTPLEIVFRNLIGNAIKHHCQPTVAGRVEISAQDAGKFVLFAVKDNGPGIDHSFHKRIFEMFQTLRPRDEVEGSGMGLSVVKKIVESRGGTIEVESSVGNGATFCFTWPKMPPPIN